MKKYSFAFVTSIGANEAIACFSKNSLFLNFHYTKIKQNK